MGDHGRNVAQPTGLTANITRLLVVPVVPIVVQNVITQPMSNFISLYVTPSVAGNSSTTITVIPGKNVTMNIGNEGSPRKIINVGIRLPENMPDLKEEEKDV
jgi:hypothetical protein